MDDTRGERAEPVAVLNENGSGGGPWGGRSDGGSDGGGNGGDGEGPRSPWSQPPRKRPAQGRVPNGPSAIDELIRKGRERFGGGNGGGGMPAVPSRPVWVWGFVALVALWLMVTGTHRIEPGERGVITRLGRYAGTLQSGFRFTFPAPIDRVTTIPVEAIRSTAIGSTEPDAQNLVLTGDQNIIDLAYAVRWNIRDPELYLYELADPDDTVRQVAESAMRAAISQVTLNDAIGSQRSQIEAEVAQRMQEVLDSYRSGIAIQGVAINQADPPAAVIDAFKEVQAAQQDAQSYLNGARAYAQQLKEKAAGEAAAFDRVYAEYALAPEVTRRRMYYETMERVLAKSDKTIVEAPGVQSYLPLPQLPKGAPAK